MDKALTGLRPYTTGDTEKLARLLGEARGWPPVGTPTPSELLLRWARWHVNPEQDITVLPDPSGELVAYSRVSLVTDPTPRVSMELTVRPDRQNTGIGSALYRLAEERAQGQGVPHITTPVYLAAGESCPGRTRFLERRGFFPDRTYWQMRLDGISSQPAPNWPSGFTFRTFEGSVADAERWAYLVREAFNEPAGVDRVLAQLSEPGGEPPGYIFAVDEATGTEVGTSRARIDSVGGRAVGYVGTVGVLHSYRNKGLASALILQTLRYLSAKGMESAVLFVEGNNHNARRLYEKMGWRPVYQTVHYWKHLSLSPEPDVHP